MKVQPTQSRDLIHLLLKSNLSFHTHHGAISLIRIYPLEIKMLSAVLNGKRRGTGLAGKNLKLSDSEGAEDVLTATVFERLAYLPESILEKIFSTNYLIWMIRLARLMNWSSGRHIT